MIAGNGAAAQGAFVHLFTYGTLRRDGAASGLLEGAERLRSAIVSGTLFDIDGRYPALLLAGSGRVHGELWRCPAARIPALDAYEGVAAGLFRRVALRVDGVAAWTWVAGAALAPLLIPERRLDNGVWTARRRRAPSPASADPYP